MTAVGDRSFHALLDGALGGVDVAVGVPCSLLGGWLSGLDDEVAHHIPCTNEGEAIAVAVGARLRGLSPVVYLQNSGLGNAVNPLTSLAQTFGVPLMLVIGYRGRPGHADEPQHQLMGAMTLPLLRAAGIDTHVPDDARQLADAVTAAAAGLAQGRTQAVLIGRGLIEPAAPIATPPADARRPTRRDYVALLTRMRGERPVSVIATTGMTGRELESLGPRDEDLYMVGSMGCAPSLALGLSLGRGDRGGRGLVVLDGDGALLMRLENMVALARFVPVPLVHVVIDNGAYDSTGGQRSLSDGVDFAAIAAGVGYASASTAGDLDRAEVVLRVALSRTGAGAHLCVLAARPGQDEKVGRPRHSPPEQARRFAAATVAR